MSRKLIALIMIIGLLSGCGLSDRSSPASPSPAVQPDGSDPQSGQFQITRLTAVPSLLNADELSVLSVETNRGGNIAYAWLVSAGRILGSGPRVTYQPDACCRGEISITCSAVLNEGVTTTTTIYITVE